MKLSQALQHFKSCWCILYLKKPLMLSVFFCSQRWTLVCGISTSAPGGAVDGAGIWRKEKAMDHMAIWCGEKDAAELGNSSKPPITPENVKGVENRSYGRRFLCTWSNIMRVTIILHAGQAGVSVWTLILMDLRVMCAHNGICRQLCCLPASEAMTKAPRSVWGHSSVRVVAL